MRHAFRIARLLSRRSPIPLFANRPSHPFVPLDDPSAGARSEGQGRSKIGAVREPLTAASTLAGWRRCGDRMPVRSAVLLFSAVLAVAIPLPCQAQPEPVQRPSQTDPYVGHIAEAAQRFGIPAAWIRAVMRVESANEVRAISSKGAMGLMQIMPATWADLRARHRLGGDPYDPRDNILAGAAYLRELHDRYGSPGFLAAYNAGPGRYEEHLAGRPLPAETRAYVATLAPLIGGGEITGPVAVAVADPLSWTRAPLFVVQADRTSSADAVQLDARSGDTPAAIHVRDVSPIVPQSGGLFVARAETGVPR
ncbi:lytic transglycosylase domain-containing protein [Brevundimonas sp. SL130]|uniref:lytic transglycosylase domain-containing protein n=1 Tax=Brevundimonas sp. SL130 TaxID=2995143 RepID=UPI00226CA786|nr:lytic transglycosylase domain-containing protein [Brevundimonas sp. SL130]WAC61291.1 lytic transglycosylase domain-containing protein [Brevundimonas sp. SL130]